MPGKIINVAVLGIGFSANVFHIPYIVSLLLEDSFAIDGVF